MTFNPYIARVAGEALDADQIEHDGYDPFYISDEELARRRAEDIERPLRRARIAARRAAGTWGVVVRDHGNGRSTVSA